MEEQGYAMPERAEYGEVVQAGQVTLAVERLGASLTDLEKIAESLAQRLEPVIAHRPHASMADEKQDRPTSAPLADELARHHDRIVSVTQRLVYLAEVLEI